MSQIQIAAALSVALTTNGTLAFTYPAGYNKGNFVTYGHELVTGSNDRFTVQNGDFTVSFGDTAVTLTFKASTTIAAGTSVVLGLKTAGIEALKDQMETKVKLVNCTEKKVIRVTLGNPVAADTDGIASALVATTTAKVYTLTDCVTAFKNTGGYIDVARNVTVKGSSAADHVVTITGKDIYNNTMIENITASSTSTIQGVKAFYKITGINIAAGASAKTIDIGWGDKLGLPIFLKSWHNIVKQTVDTELIATNNKVRVDCTVAIVAANAGTSQFVASPVYGFVSKASVAICAAFTTGGSVVPKIATVAVTGLSVTVGTGAAGTVYTDDATAEFGATGEIAKDLSIEFAGDSAFDSVGNFMAWVEITPGGAVVVGDETVPTATTGDVRGTWTPPTALTNNGTRTYVLDIEPTDFGYIGLDQYGS